MQHWESVHLRRCLVPTQAICQKQFPASDRLSPEIARRALDLDHVLARALQIMAPETVIDWLEGMEPTFNFARPIDVLALQGSAPLLTILDRIEAGAYA